MLGQLTSAIGRSAATSGASTWSSRARRHLPRRHRPRGRRRPRATADQAMSAVPGIVVHELADRTFLVHLGGKIEVKPKAPARDARRPVDGLHARVARVCMAIAEDPAELATSPSSATLSRSSRDGTAVLGLGNIGPEAAMPVMEGKAMLFKEFGDVDAFPLCLATQTSTRSSRLSCNIAPDLRRHQPRGHRRPTLFRDRAPSAGASRHSRCSTTISTAPRSSCSRR